MRREIKIRFLSYMPFSGNRQSQRGNTRGEEAEFSKATKSVTTYSERASR